MERKHVVSRHGRILKIIPSVDFYVFDETYFSDGRRTITFYNSDRKFVERVDAQPGDWVTPLEIGFCAPTIPTN